MSLKDFRTDPSDLPPETPDHPAPASLYRVERDSLKLDRLSTRMTIISLILPFFMAVVLFFIYLDMKDRLKGVDAAKNTQVDHLSRQMEEKLNALDIRIAKNRFDLDEKLPLLENKSGLLEQQVGKLAVSKADGKTLEEGIATLEDRLGRLDKRIQNNADQNQANLAELERVNTTLLSSLEQNQVQVETRIRALKQEVASLESLKQEVISLQPLKKEVASLQAQIKDTRADLEPFQKSLNRLETKARDLENQIMARTEISRRLMALETRMDEALKKLQQQIPSPPLPVPDSISEETLTQ